jgi:hypothetical protein
MIVKSLIANIGHGLNGNKLVATPLIYIHHNKKNIHWCRMIEITHSWKFSWSHNKSLNFLNNPISYNKFYEWENQNCFDANAIVIYYHLVQKL